MNDPYGTRERCGRCGVDYEDHARFADYAGNEDMPPHEWEKPRRRSSRSCPDCGHAAKHHYGPEGDPYNGESGCMFAWQCFDGDWDGCRCKWDGRPKRAA